MKQISPSNKDFIMEEKESLLGTKKEKKDLDSYIDSLYFRVDEHSFLFLEQMDMDIFKGGFYECLKMIADGKIEFRDGELHIKEPW